MTCLLSAGQSSRLWKRNSRSIFRADGVGYADPGSPLDDRSAPTTFLKTPVVFNSCDVMGRGDLLSPVVVDTSLEV